VLAEESFAIQTSPPLAMLLNSNQVKIFTILRGKNICGWRYL